MRKQIRHMAQSKLTLLSMDRAPEEMDFMLYGTLKMVYLEQVQGQFVYAMRVDAHVVRT